MFASLRDFLISSAGLLWNAGEVTLDQVWSYLRLLMRAGVVLGTAVVVEIILIVVLLSLGVKESGVYSLISVLIASEACIFLFLAYPFLFAATAARDRFPQVFLSAFVQPTKIIAALFFIGLMGGIFWAVTPIAENPLGALRVFAVLIAVGVGSYAGWVVLPLRIGKRLITVQLVAILGVAIFSFLFPGSARSLGRMLQQSDEVIPIFFDSPRTIKVDKAENIEFVDVRTGEYKIWYYRNEPGQYELYDRRGYHRTGIPLERADTSEEIEDIMRAYAPLDEITEHTALFDPEGKPLVWYYLSSAGNYELFRRPGVHPSLGIPLEPMTPAIAKVFRVWLETDQRLRKEKADSERAASGNWSSTPPIRLDEITDQMALFDPAGKPLVWFHRADTGDYELFRRPGMHPVLGVPLEPMTPQSAKTFHDWLEKRQGLRQEDAARERKADETSAAENEWKTRMKKAADDARTESERWQRLASAESLSAESAERNAKNSLTQGDRFSVAKDYKAATQAFNQAKIQYHTALETGIFGYRDRLVAQLNDLLSQGQINHSDVDRSLNGKILQADELVKKGEYESAAAQYRAIFSPYMSTDASPAKP